MTRGRREEWRRGKSPGDSRSSPTREAGAARAKDTDALKLKPVVVAIIVVKPELLCEETYVKHCRESDARSLRGGGGELRNLKP
jgi:hypothetical protein